MASPLRRGTKRKRKVCPKCDQELSYSAYIRHKNPVVCKDKRSLFLYDNVNEDRREDTCMSEIIPSEVQVENESTDQREDVMSSPPVTGSNDKGNDTDQGSEVESGSDGIPIYSDTEDTDARENTNGVVPACRASQLPSESEQLSDQNSEVTLTVKYVCMFMSFFQLFYRISEHGITLMLTFLKAFISWICSLCPQSLELKLLHDRLPSNVYFLRKIFDDNCRIITYVVCPKCHSIYSYNQCVITHHNGTTEAAKCCYIQHSRHPQMFRRTKCNTPLLKKVRWGSAYKLRPRMLYSYNSIKSTLTKLFSRPNFYKNCEHWRSRDSSSQLLTDVYDGKVWNDFHVVNEKPYLNAPNNLCLKLNVDWFTPFKHIQYSVGVIYLVIENLPRSMRYKLENLIIVGCIPGPREPKKHINSFLKPLVDELLELWNGVLLRTSSLFGFTPVRCALTCITCDLPATRKVCGFVSYCASMGCSKCMKKFICSAFGEKMDYSGFEKGDWPLRTHAEHLMQVSEFQAATTTCAQQQIEKKYGVRYSELLRLPYLDIVNFHVVDPMHNLLLGTAKHLTTLWKEAKILTSEDFNTIQERVDRMEVPVNVGRIPYKISSNFSSFTADQWKNWVCVYSLFCLHGILPMEHYSCWSLFVEACLYFLLPSISMQDLENANTKITEFCNSFETLYGKGHCTPNMHMHLHIKESILNYGPVYGFWCFPFERYNGILGNFQRNWTSPEIQMIRKFIAYQDLLLCDLPSTLPLEMYDFFQLHLSMQSEKSITEGSLEQSHIDCFSLLEYKKNRLCPLSTIDARENAHQIISQRYEQYFDHTEVSSLREVYKCIYAEKDIHHIPMVHERFQEVTVLGESFQSKSVKGKHSAAICAYWPGIGGTITASCSQLRVGIVQYFIRHSICLDDSCVNLSHVFARVYWYGIHPRENWFHHHLLVVSPDMIISGPSTFLPLSRCFSRCGLISETVNFDFGEDNVLIASLLYCKYFV